MLGRFQEVSVSTTDIRESLEFYESLGFVQSSVGDARDHPYAVVTDGRLHLGLHQQPFETPRLTWLHPGLAEHQAKLKSAGLTIDFAALDEESFHEIGLRDPTGLPISLIEARTYSPADVAASFVSRLGYFEEIGLPTTDLEACARFWDALGLVAFEPEHEPFLKVSIAARDINLGLYKLSLQRPVLTFSVDDVGALEEKLHDSGCRFSALPHDLSSTDCALLEAPEGSQFLLIAETELTGPT